MSDPGFDIVRDLDVLGRLATTGEEWPEWPGEARGEYVPQPAVAPPSQNGAVQIETLEDLTIVSLDAFVAVEEEGASALVGTPDAALIPQGGDVMFYGDGGAGKTSLAVDLACHLAAGDSWLGMPVAGTVRVLLVENEGPRPLLRAKLRRKKAGWRGSELGGRVTSSRPRGRASRSRMRSTVKRSPRSSARLRST